MSRGKKPFVAKDSIKEFNQFRQSVKFPLTEEQLKKGLKNFRIPYGPGFIAELCRSSIITKTRDGYYTFSKQDSPVSYVDLQKVYQEYHYKTLRKPKKPWKQNQDKISQAIKFLQGRGFIVLMDASKVYDLVVLKGGFDIATHLRGNVEAF